MATDLAFNSNGYTNNGALGSYNSPSAYPPTTQAAMYSAGGTNYSPTSVPTPSAPTSPTVVTSTAASNDLSKISTNLNNTIGGIQNQAANVSANTANAAATKAQTDAAAADRAQQAALIQAKIDSLKNTVASDTGTSINGAKAPAGWDAQTYSNFKAANPNLEPTAEDTARMQSAGQPNQAFGVGGLIYTPRSDGGYDVTGGDGKYLGKSSAPGQGIDNTSTQTTTSPNGTPGANYSDANQLSAQAMKHADDTYNQILGIQNGTIPLTAVEQAQVDNLKNQFQNLIKQTQDANQNYQNGLNVLGAESGRQRFTPETHLGSVNDAIQKGIQKVADITMQMSSAVAQMEQGFKDNDIKMIKAANDDFQAASKDRVSFLTKMTEDAASAIKDSRDFAAKQVQQDFENNLASDKFNYQQTQDAIDNAFKSQQITETQRANMADEALKRAAQQGIDNGGTIPSLPVVKMTSNDTPSKADQAAFLSGLPTDIQTLVKGLADYSLNPNISPQKQYKGAAGLNQAQMLALVKQYDPTYDEKQYATRQAVLTNFKSGKYSQNINSLNTGIGHLTDLTTNLGNLGNSGFTPYNASKNWLETQFGVGNISSATTNISAATNELASIFKGSGATDQEIKDWKGSLSANMSPDQQKAFINTALQLLADRVNALDSTYQTGMGKAKEGGFLNDANQLKLINLQKQGYTINIPELANNPTILLQTYRDTSPENAAALQKIRVLAPNASPQDTIDLLAQQGISL